MALIGHYLATSADNQNLVLRNREAVREARVQLLVDDDHALGNVNLPYEA